MDGGDWISKQKQIRKKKQNRSDRRQKRKSEMQERRENKKKLKLLKQKKSIKILVTKKIQVSQVDILKRTSDRPATGTRGTGFFLFSVQRRMIRTKNKTGDIKEKAKYRSTREKRNSGTSSRHSG